MRAYRALSQQYRPDRNEHPDATRIIKILNEAYAVLGDEQARAGYDRQLAAEDALAKMSSGATQRVRTSASAGPRCTGAASARGSVAAARGSGEGGCGKGAPAADRA
ncbi:MAG: hypothetical protein QOC89_3352 [Paraburkholderia sp.]|nr:hypothetical protein [Paraburkholderia sp.]